MSQARGVQLSEPAVRRRDGLRLGAGAIAGAGLFAGGSHLSLASAAMPTVQPERIGHLLILAAQEGILQPGDGGSFELILRDLEPRVLYFTD